MTDICEWQIIGNNIERQTIDNGEWQSMGTDNGEWERQWQMTESSEWQTMGKECNCKW